jgi:hypothetical protein
MRSRESVGLIGSDEDESEFGTDLFQPFVITKVATPSWEPILSEYLSL